MLEILATYDSVSGQQINQNKTSLFFSKLTSEEEIEILRKHLEFPKFCTMISTWGCHLLLGSTKNQASIT